MTTEHETVAALKKLGTEMSLLNHPFYRQWTAGTLSAERLRNYAIQYYRHVAAFPRYLSALHSRTDDLETRQVLLENLIEEERGAENHPELWLKFAGALGVSREAVLAEKALPAATTLVATFDRLSRESPLVAGLGALYVYESQVAEVADVKIDGLKRFYGFVDGISDNNGAAATAPGNKALDAKADGTKFFEVHRAADPHHALAIAALIERHCDGAEDRVVALEAARTALSAVWDLLDSV